MYQKISGSQNGFSCLLKTLSYVKAQCKLNLKSFLQLFKNNSVETEFCISFQKNKVSSKFVE